MIRSRWLLGLSLFSLATMPGCGWLPGLSGASLKDAPQGFSLLVSAPDQYRGTSALSMRFTMPRHGPYAVAAVSSDIDHIDVTLTEPFPMAVPPSPPLPIPMPSGPQTEPNQAAPAIAPSTPVKAVHPTPALPPQPVPVAITDPGPTAEPIPMPMPKPPILAKPLYQPMPPIAQATVTRTELDQGQGSVVFDALMAGSYGLQLVAYGRDGQVLGKVIQSVEVQEGQTASIDATLVLDGVTQSNSVSVNVSIVDGPPGATGAGSAGAGVATASPTILIGQVNFSE